MPTRDDASLRKATDVRTALELQLAATVGDSEVSGALKRGYSEGGYRRAMRLRADIAARRSQRTFVAPTTVAAFYAVAGEKELAMDWLEKGYDERDGQMVRLTGLPRWDTLRDHPRFQNLLRRMKLPN